MHQACRMTASGTKKNCIHSGKCKCFAPFPEITVGSNHIIVTRPPKPATPNNPIDPSSSRPTTHFQQKDPSSSRPATPKRNVGNSCEFPLKEWLSFLPPPPLAPFPKSVGAAIKSLPHATPNTQPPTTQSTHPQADPHPGSSRPANPKKQFWKFAFA